MYIYSYIYKDFRSEIEWGELYIYIYIVFSNFVLLGHGVLHGQTLLVLMVASVLFWVKIGYLKFLVLRCNVAIIRVRLIYKNCFVLSCYLVICVVRHFVMDPLAALLFVQYWYAFTNRSYVYGSVSWFLVEVQYRCFPLFHKLILLRNFAILFSCLLQIFLMFPISGIFCI